MREIEDRTDYTISELLDVVKAQRIKIEEAVLIVWYGCQAAGESFESVDVIGDSVFEEKLTNPRLRQSLAEFLLACLYSPDEAKKKYEEKILPILELSETG